MCYSDGVDPDIYKDDTLAPNVKLKGVSLVKIITELNDVFSFQLRSIIHNDFVRDFEYADNIFP